MRWLITGARGMLGQDLASVLGEAGEEVIAWDRDDLDVTDRSAVSTALMHARPDVVVNCAAYTAVDLAEEHEAESFVLNALGPAALAAAARDCGARFVQVSTDYVFAGVETRPYEASDPVHPVSAYGRTKAAGEWAARLENPDTVIVRTAWLYGRHGACFPRTMARLAQERDHLEVVADQVGQPTWTVDLAHLVLRLVRATARGGIYHGTASGQTSWFGFTQAVLEETGREPARVAPLLSSDFARPAPRPAYSVLGHESLRSVGVEPIGDWRERWTVAAPRVLDDFLPAGN